MEILQTPLQDLLIIKPRVFEDQRGYFFESFNANVFQEAGLNYNFVQDNESKSSYGVVRGLHYQLNPYAQAKLVRVIEGKVFDVAVDLRKGSPTFGKWYGEILSGENKTQLLIPRGFAHGFSVLSPTAVFIYKCDNFYNRESEAGIHIMDEKLAIDWNLKAGEMVVSDKDQKQPGFDQAKMNFHYA